MTRAEQLEQMNQEAAAMGLDAWVPVFADLMRSINALHDRLNAEENHADLVDVLAGALADASSRIGEGMGPNVAPSAAWLLRYQQDVQAVRARREAEEESRWAEDEEA